MSRNFTSTPARAKSAHAARDNVTGSPLPVLAVSSPIFGNGIQLGAFGTDHALSFFSGATLGCIVDFEEIQPFNGQRMFIRNTRPLVDGGTPSVAIGVRELLENTVSYGTAVAINVMGWCPQRMTGRYVRARITMPAGGNWTHIQGVELDADPAGVR